ncbi:phosphoribosylanthranilate isomerase [Sansalvadorimonas verongulae]|nr:phosphoribosylanthranilate isomerase [Sansalvadorimonas verongulae]
MKVKICGLRNPSDAQVAAECGADAIGFMFYEPSPRNLTLEEGRVLSQTLKGKVTRTGVFVNPEPVFLEQLLNTVELDALQFHGDETNEFCRQWGLPWIKAVRVRENSDVAEELSQWTNASAFLLDSYTPGVYGGTGEAFDWGRFPKHLKQPLILAGGLSPANVAEAIATVQPWAIDVSSGVERSRGIKDETLIREFMKEVNNVC